MPGAIPDLGLDLEIVLGVTAADGDLEAEPFDCSVMKKGGDRSSSPFLLPSRPGGSETGYNGVGMWFRRRQVPSGLSRTYKRGTSTVNARSDVSHEVNNSRCRDRKASSSPRTPATSDGSQHERTKNDLPQWTLVVANHTSSIKFEIWTTR